MRLNIQGPTRALPRRAIPGRYVISIALIDPECAQCVGSDRRPLSEKLISGEQYFAEFDGLVVMRCSGGSSSAAYAASNA
jgi:hypothetical protein